MSAPTWARHSLRLLVHAIKDCRAPGGLAFQELPGVACQSQRLVSSTSAEQERATGKPQGLPQGTPLTQRFFKSAHVVRAEGQEVGWLTARWLAHALCQACSHSASASKQGFSVTLDSRQVKTPGRRPLVLPTYPVALAVAAEWEWQVRFASCLIHPCASASWQWLCCSVWAPSWLQRYGKPQMHTMPMMSIAATAIDQVCASPFPCSHAC
jgi:hypothetical protein